MTTRTEDIRVGKMSAMEGQFVPARCDFYLRVALDEMDLFLASRDEGAAMRHLIELLKNLRAYRRSS